MEFFARLNVVMIITRLSTKLAGSLKSGKKWPRKEASEDVKKKMFFTSTLKRPNDY